MAITKVGTMSNPPGSNDWTTLMSHVQGVINRYNSTPSILSQDNDKSILPYIKQGTYISMGGTLYIVDTEDYAISGTITSGATNYIYLTSDSTTLTATWTTDISGYSWNSIYNYMSDGTNILLPYSVYYDGTSYTMYSAKAYGINVQMGQDIVLTADSSATTDPGDIIFRNNDGTEKARIFADNLDSILNFSVGSSSDNMVMKLYENGDLESTGNLLPTANPTSGTQTVTPGASWTPPRGVYMMSIHSLFIYMRLDGDVEGIRFQNGAIITDGVRVVLKSSNTDQTISINYLKF